ncbi:MAG TPA: superinfection immunity protein [Xanthobacteraceae bacterium]|nr:superinfection immunity protein [Xanthobacteraceae bacterium]
MRDLVKILFFFAVAAGIAITILSNPQSLLSGFLMIVVAIFVYLLPTVVAANRKHNNEGAILALNLFLGWTLLGWVAAFVWALTDNTRA